MVELPPLKVKDLPKMETKDPEGFYEFVCQMTQELKASSGVIWNTFEELESSALEKLRQELCIPIYPIGPFHKHSTTSASNPSSNSSCFICCDSVLCVIYKCLAATEKLRYSALLTKYFSWRSSISFKKKNISGANIRNLPHISSIPLKK